MNKSQRVLQIGTGNFGKGGLSTIVLNFGLNQDPNKIIFDYLVMDKVHDKKYKIQIENKKGKVYELKTNNKLKRLYLLKKFFKENKYEIIHIHISQCKISTLIIQFLYKIYGGKKIILHSHSSGIDINKGSIKIALLKHNIFKRILPLMTDEFLTCSKLAGEWLYPKKYLDKVKIINNGIDVEKYKFDLEKRNQLRKEMNLENKVILGTVGRFSYQKNHEFLIKIFNEVQKIEKESVLLLIGNGELEQKIKEQVKELKLENKVIFLGTTNKVEDYLQIMDIFLLPSKYEGLPIVGIESQASGLKCFFSKNITKELKITDLCGFLDINISPKEWAEQILKYKNTYERKDITKEIEKAGYSIKSSAKELEKIYLNLN